MQQKAFRASPRMLREALARDAYEQDRIRLVERRIAGCECLVSTRQGLHAVARDGTSRLLVHGLFFGLCRDGDMLYAFEAGDSPHVDGRRGRLLAFALRDGRLENERIIAKDLPNGCHQLARIDRHLCLVDTHNQAVWRFNRDGALIDICRPFEGGDDAPYHHPNSLAPWDGGALILLHNGARGGAAPSELAWCDADWIVRRRTALSGHCCHDIVADAGGRLWHCGSMAGELITSDGARHKVSDRMTRGLIVTPELFVVGASDFGRRSVRDDLGGAVLFLDRSFKQLGEAVLPSGPAALVSV